MYIDYRYIREPKPRHFKKSKNKSPINQEIDSIDIFKGNDQYQCNRAIAELWDARCRVFSHINEPLCIESLFQNLFFLALVFSKFIPFEKHKIS